MLVWSQQVILSLLTFSSMICKMIVTIFSSQGWRATEIVCKGPAQESEPSTRTISFLSPKCSFSHVPWRWLTQEWGACLKMQETACLDNPARKNAGHILGQELIRREVKEGGGLICCFVTSHWETFRKNLNNPIDPLFDLWGNWGP